MINPSALLSLNRLKNKIALCFKSPPLLDLILIHHPSFGNNVSHPQENSRHAPTKINPNDTEMAVNTVNIATLQGVNGASGPDPGTSGTNDIQGNKRLRSPGANATGLEPAVKRTQNHPVGSFKDRKYAIKVLSSVTKVAATRRELARAIESIQLPDAKVREVLKTNDGILVFADSARDYNILINSDRWSQTGAPTIVKIATKKSTEKAIVIHKVELAVEPEEIVKALKLLGFPASSAHCLRRIKDGQPTNNIKVFVDDESKIDEFINKGFYFDLHFHPVSRFLPPKYRQCYFCQDLTH